MTEETKFEVRPELLTASPWTEEDGIIREFFFLNEEFHARAIWRSGISETSQATLVSVCLRAVGY
jgi:hypothetical protein